MSIIKYTTPTIKFTFAEVLPSDMNKAVLTVTQLGKVIIERDLTTATIGENSISWRLRQDETMKLKVGIDSDILCDWLLNDGTRGRSVLKKESVERTGLNEVM